VSTPVDVSDGDLIVVARAEWERLRTERDALCAAILDLEHADLSTHTDDKGRRRMVGYVASMDHESLRCAEDYGIKQTPAVHMPRWAARILLDVVSVRVERLHAIDDADAEREAGEIVAGVLGAGGGLFSVFVAMLFVSNGPTPSVLRGLLVDALVWALFCALFLRRAPEVTL
jgi:hypothetical protein